MMLPLVSRCPHCGKRHIVEAALCVLILIGIFALVFVLS